MNATQSTLLTLRAIVFTILIPGAIAGYLPYSISLDSSNEVELGPLRYCGLLVMAVGILFYAASAYFFVIKGGGTPAIWFTKPIRFIIGEEPKTLVFSGLYRFTRNPMYLGIVSTVLGEAIYFEKKALFLYALLLWLIFHFVIIIIEEPHLRRREGEMYEAYCKTVPRWLRFWKKRE